MPNYYFDKIFIEARFNGSLLFNDMSRLQEIINQLSNILPMNQYESNAKALILANQTIHLNVNILDNRITIDMDTPNSFENYNKYAIEILKAVTEQLKISKFSRIGMRCFRGIEMKSINEANNFIKRNFIKYNSTIYKELSDDIKGFGIGFSFSIHNTKVNLNIKPNDYQLIEIIDGKVNLNKRSFQVLIDSDVYQEGNLEVEKVINNFFDEVVLINNTKIDNFIRKVSIY